MSRERSRSQPLSALCFESARFVPLPRLPGVTLGNHGAPHPDFASFGNRSRWATRGQFCDVAEYSKLLDMFFAAGMMSEGDLTAIHWSMLACPPATFRAAMRMVQRRGVRVSGAWGTFPGPGPASGVDGPPYRERFGAQLAALDDIFGPANWMGEALTTACVSRWSALSPMVLWMQE